MALTGRAVNSLGYGQNDNRLALINESQTRGQLTTASMPNELEPWFGRPNRDVPMNPYDHQAVELHHIWDAYKGQSMFLRRTIIGLVTRYNEWYTTMALPWLKTDQQHFMWSEVRYNVGLAGIVPPEGVPRLLTSSERTFESGTNRRGLAMMMELDFFRTPQGQQQYERNLQGIRASVQETANLEVSFEISNARNAWREQELQRGTLRTNINKLADYETDTFAIVNRSARGTSMMLGRLEEAMRESLVEPNMMIVKPGFRRYYDQLDPEKTMYWSAGPNGVMLLREGPIALGRIGSLQLFEARRLDISHTAPPVEPFSKDARYGTFIPMINEYRDTNNNFQWSTNTRAVKFWDETAGNYVRVNLGDALLYSFRFDKQTGDLDKAHDDLAALGRKDGAVSAPGMQGPGYNPLFVSQNVSKLTSSRLAGEFRDMFLYLKNNGDFGVVDFWGLMEPMAATAVDFRDVAEQAAARLYGREALTAASSALDSLLMLVHNSENIPYNERWYALWQQVNHARQINGNNYGQLTADEIATHRQVPKVVEMVPTPEGFLTIPVRTPEFQEWTVPPHINSFPAFAQLASMQNTASNWDTAISIVIDGLKVINDIKSISAQVFGSSLFLQPRNRAPWFQIPDARTVLVHDIIVGPRDGVMFYIVPLQNDDKATTPAVPAGRNQAGTSAAKIVSSTDVVDAIGGQIKATLNALDTVAAGIKDNIVYYALRGLNAEVNTGAECKDAVCTIAKLAYAAVGVYHQAEAKKKGSGAAELAQINQQLVTIAQSTYSKVVEKDLVAAEAKVQALLKKRVFQPTPLEPLVPGITPFDETAVRDAPLTEAQQRQLAAHKRASDAAADVAQGDDLLQADVQTPGQKTPAISAANYANGFWVRAPVNSYRLFAETALKSTMPLALPTNPLKGHIAPLLPTDSTKDNILRSSKYTSALERQFTQSAVSSDLSVAEAGVRFQFTKSVWDASAPVSEEVGQKRRASATTGIDERQPSNVARSTAAFSMSRASQFESQEVDSLLPPRTFHPMDGEDTSMRDRTDEYSDLGRPRYIPREHHSDVLSSSGMNVIDLAKGSAQPSQKFNALRSQLDESVFAKRWRDGAIIANHVVRAFHQVFLGTRVRLSQMQQTLGAGVNVPVNALLWRLWITRRMFSAPVMRGGLETGATFYGNVDAMVGEDAYAKLTFTNITFTMKGQIIDARGVAQAPHAIAEDYKGGNGSSFIIDPQDVHWNERRPNGDILVTLIPHAEVTFPEPMSVYGTYALPDIDPEALSEDQRNLHYSSAPYYTVKLGLKKVAQRQMIRHAQPRYGDTLGLVKPQLLANRDTYWSWDPNTQTFSVKHVGANVHGGENSVGPHAARVWRGNDVMFKDGADGYSV